MFAAAAGSRDSAVVSLAGGSSSGVSERSAYEEKVQVRRTVASTIGGLVLWMRRRTSRGQFLFSAARVVRAARPIPSLSASG